MVWHKFNPYKSSGEADHSTSSSSSVLSTSSMPSSASATAEFSNTSGNSIPSGKRPSSLLPPRPPPRTHRGGNTASGNRTFPSDLPFSETPAGRFFTQFFGEAMQYFDYPMDDIAWCEEPPATYSGRHGDHVNEKIINNDQKFSIEMDLSDYLPEELSVTYDEEARELLVEGHQKERTDRLGSIERHFKRKFDIPVDTHDGTLAAYFSSSGLLTLLALKKGVRSAIRRIPIQTVPEVPNPLNTTASDTGTSEGTKKAGKLKIAPAIHPKPKKVLVEEDKPSNIQKVPTVAEKLPQSKKARTEDEKESNFEDIHRPSKKCDIKREYLNIFCKM